jgi:hypothetical protein
MPTSQEDGGMGQQLTFCNFGHGIRGWAFFVRWIWPESRILGELCAMIVHVYTGHPCISMYAQNRLLCYSIGIHLSSITMSLASVLLLHAKSPSSSPLYDIKL